MEQLLEWTPHPAIGRGADEPYGTPDGANGAVGE